MMITKTREVGDVKWLEVFANEEDVKYDYIFASFSNNGVFDISGSCGGDTVQLEEALKLYNSWKDAGYP